MNALSYLDTLSLIDFLSLKNICIPIKFDKNKNNCNKRIVDLFDENIETKYEITCIPLLTLEKLYIKYINSSLPSKKEFKNLIEYKKKIFEILNENNIFNIKNGPRKFDIFKNIKYYFKIVLNKKYYFWDEKSNPIIDFFDKLTNNDNYKKYLNFIKFYNDDAKKK